MSIHGPIFRQLLASPLRTRVVDDRGKYNGVQLLVAATHVAAKLRSVCESKSVGIVLPTGAGFPIAAFATWMLGKVAVPMNYLLKQDELQYIIDDCETDTIVTAGPMLDFLGYTPRCKNIIKLETLDFKSFPDPVFPTFADDRELGVLLYTSGTSGKPKGVMLTHDNIRSNISQVDRWIDLGPSDTFLGVLPQFHSFGMTALTLLPLTLGCKAVFTARFLPSKIYNLLREHKPNVFVAIPSMYNALLHVRDAKPEDWAGVTYLVSGGEPLPDAVAQGFFEKFGVRIAEGYGLTETSPATNWCRPHQWKHKSVGQPLPDLEQRIVDTGGKVLGPNIDGEVQMRGPNIMRGYFKLPEQTAGVFTADGFFKTGDMGRHDNDGHLYITGRIKEMLIVGGENVFPREIEEVLNKHEAVKDSGVVGRMDPSRGEVPVAFVELKDGATIDASTFSNTMRSWCRQSLAGYKVPDEVRVVEALPRNATGKILRRELKKLV
jgi:long-chain acyl-CoA synthetase